MSQLIENSGSHSGWSEADWTALDILTTKEALATFSESKAQKVIVRMARSVLRRYSSSFFIVTRFLPPAKRAHVEMIYAAVRYPDEVVDTFLLAPEEKRLLLSQWRLDFERGLVAGSIIECLRQGLPAILAGFVQLFRDPGIPCEYYYAFLDAMEADIEPGRYVSLNDLIDNYIYGSAIVVGYFLAYVYGASADSEFPRMLEVSRRLGIALQLTNFLRDINEDWNCGRLYLPQDLLTLAGIIEPDPGSSGGREALGQVVLEMSAVARANYEYSRSNLDAFAPDCRVAIRACIDVYGLLNELVGQASAFERRQTVSVYRKFAALPASKYWRLPLAYFGAI